MMVEDTSITNITKSRHPLCIVVDASMIVAWVLDDEKCQPIDHFIQQCTLQDIKLVAPSLMMYEIANSLKSAIVAKRITQEQALAQIQLVTALHIDTTRILSSEELVRTAVRFEISAYDAAYVLLAKQLDAPLYTLDVKLHKKVNQFIQCVVP